MTKKGARWVERILSLKDTWRLQARSTYAVLVDAVRCYVHGQLPNTAWLSFAKRQLCLPVIGYEISGLACRCYPHVSRSWAFWDVGCIQHTQERSYFQDFFGDAHAAEVCSPITFELVVSSLCQNSLKLCPQIA